MKKIGLFKKISLYLSYRKALLDNKNELLSGRNFRIDGVNRLYTVVNVPPELFDEAYTMKTSDINKISEPYITEFVKQVSDILDSKGLRELYEIYDISKIDRFSYLVIFGFKFFNTDRVAKSILFKFIPTGVTLTAVLIILEHFKLLTL